MKKLFGCALWVALVICFSAYWIKNKEEAKPLLEKNKQVATIKSPLERLIDGNDRYVNNKSIHPNQSSEIREESASKQTPFAIVIGCADSRVSPEIIFDQGIGDLFVVRVAGNVVGPVELDSIEFAVDKLKVPLLVVLGHEKCAAVNSVLTQEASKDDLEQIAPFIEPAVQKAAALSGDALTNAIQMNIQEQIDNLMASSILHSAVLNHELKIVGGYYYLDKGNVEFQSKP
jgi:carbonic anhydrase